MLNKKGFTLIELLVVISIIGLLASLGMYSFNLSRIKSRDAKRMADLDRIKLALELYYDNNGAYPNGQHVYGSGYFMSSTWFGDWGWLASELSPYIDPLPVDPLNYGTAFRRGEAWPQAGYAYAYINRGDPNDPNVYDLIAALEDEGSEYTCANKCYYSYTRDHPWCEACVLIEGDPGTGFNDNIYANH